MASTTLRPIALAPGASSVRRPKGGLSFPPGTWDPVKRWGRLYEMAFLDVSLASEKAGYATGQCVMANGGKYSLYDYDDPHPYPELRRERSLQSHRPSLRSAGFIALLGC
jgi:hypothetical protein